MRRPTNPHGREFGTIFPPVLPKCRSGWLGCLPKQPHRRVERSIQAGCCAVFRGRAIDVVAPSLCCHLQRYWGRLPPGAAERTGLAFGPAASQAIVVGRHGRAYRTPSGQTWPSRVDQLLTKGLSDADVDAWVRQRA
jgi:hypothetical protein